MQSVDIVCSIAIPWLEPNVDTDVITPMKRLLLNMPEIERYAFEPLRYIDGDGDRGIPDMRFPLNNPKYRNAQIMITGPNFGCGSSRETASEAIVRCGIRCLIGSSFGTIFQKNCYQMGLLPIQLEQTQVERLAAIAEEGGEFVVELSKRRLTASDGSVYEIPISESRQKTLLLEQADTALIRTYAEEINAYFCRAAQKTPWIM